MRSKWTLLAVVLITSVGCYRYQPVRPDEVAVGATVRLRLAETAAERLREALNDPDLDRTLDGEVVGQDAGSLLLSVERQVRSMGYTAKVLAQRVDVPRGDILGLELKELDRTRTGVIGGAVLAAGFYLIIKALKGESLQPGEPGSPPTTESIVPARFRIPFP